MARLSERLPENVAGEFYVDRTCIDCDTCRQIVPSVFTRSEVVGQSFVGRQPSGAEEHRRSLMALVACPTASIGTVRKLDVRPGVLAFPELIEEGVYYCGFTAESSFGASSYFIRRPAGNVLIDSPRAARPLMNRLRLMGGVGQMFLTHRDDVADHQTYHREFGCERLLHRADLSAAMEAERPFDGVDPIRIADDLVIIPVPGHTQGSAALLYREKFLFTGDHLWGDEDEDVLGASRGVCWYSWSEQLRSLERLLDFRFQWVLPGHGRRFGPRSQEEMHRELKRLLTLLRGGRRPDWISHSAP
jgi:glyoxylase-like metal-dependent hydrolase (beta-lactamase superfamily II)/ferredoxin